ncbi:hypothetical protein GHA01_09380 [Novacetimonas hansenii]|uniref:Uncharacterized protein n=2 Tax=Novacetimonas hansenii TaxID=436 RepID=A0ABQ0SCX6_NOVHA|nr:hypothetical protein Gaha_0364_015 [Novacetimonas hansenii JCM 7643]GEC63089.1 hypothetical protein GHA01_09380 [Novacetimonas hansenii]
MRKTLIMDALVGIMAKAALSRKGAGRGMPGWRLERSQGTATGTPQGAPQGAAQGLSLGTS